MIVANLLGFGNPIELAIIAGVVVVLFGGTKIADFGKSLGQGLKEFKKATKEEPETTEVVPSTAASTDTTKTVE